MAKKKNKPQVINNIQELNLEIDYDKLAESIVKAQEKSETKSNENKKFTSDAFAMIISLAFRGVAILGWLIMLVMPLLIINIIKTADWCGFVSVAGNILAILIVTALTFLLFAFSRVLWKSGKEVEREKDGNYIVSVFSGVVSFAALIVALIALFKGVG